MGWTKNPIPAFKCLLGEPWHKHVAGLPDLPSCPDEPQFAPPSGLSSDYWGFMSKTPGSDTPRQKWLPFIGDFVKVPDAPGRYVLSWRWDAEQTPQVWTNCADIYIQDKKPVIL